MAADLSILIHVSLILIPNELQMLITVKAVIIFVKLAI